MSDPNVAKWKPAGITSVWRYLDNARNFPGWHLTADAESCAALQQLFEQMLLAKYSVKTSLLTCPPTQELLCVPNNQGGKARWESVEKLHLKFDPAKQDNHWIVNPASDGLHIEIGRGKLESLRDGVRDITRGKGDYSIGPEDDSQYDEQCLWFWWQ